jgi:iron complex transport system permease protein
VRGSTKVERKRGRAFLVVAISASVLLVLCLCSVGVGSRQVNVDQVVRALSDGAASGIDIDSIRLRVPRTLLGIVIGAALATAGALMQAVTRNPLADPTILGLNSGAACAIVVSMAVFGLTTPSQYVWVGLLGGTLGAAIVWCVGSLGRGGPSPLKLTLAGAVVGSMFSSITTAVLLPRIEMMSTYRFWAVGGLSGARFSTLLPILPIVIAGFVCAVAVLPGLNALSLGDDVAVGLGSSPRRTQLVAWVGAILLCGASTSLAGPIGFVGLVVPHVARILVGADYKRIVAMGCLLGPILLLGADVLGRFLTRPADVEVGIVTAVIGAPVFVGLVRMAAKGKAE